MRTILLFDDVDASSAQTSDVINFEKRAEWNIQVTNSGLDGTPRLIIEYSVDNAEGTWNPLHNSRTDLTFFPIDDNPVAVIDDRLLGKFYRIRLEPNDNTTGTVSADIGYKTYP